MAIRRHNLGFTLIELVLVLMVLALIATMAAPMLSGFVRSQRMPNAAQELATTARWCRVQAISEGITYRLNFDVDGGRWWVTKDDGTGTNFVPVTTAFMSDPYVLPEGVALSTDIPADTDGKRFISFDAGGRSDVAKIALTCQGVEVDVTCDTPRSGYHVVSKNG